MKTKITILALTISFFSADSQTLTADFESFTLAPNSAYSPTTSTPFQTNNASFEYSWDTSFGGYWSGGFSYTNKYDSITQSYSNLYGVRALKGYTNSAIYVVGQDGGKIKLTAPQSTVAGFYVTNTTYVWKTIAKGDQFARKFGDTTGTGSGTTIPQGSYPDFFKLVVRGYDNGALKSDSVVFLLADYTFTNNTQDYIVNTWQYVNTTSLGEVDSLLFVMRSSDVGQFGINTPLFFAIDNFSTLVPNSVGIYENHSVTDVVIFPNPFQSHLKIRSAFLGKSLVSDISGKVVYEQELKQDETILDLTSLTSGIYFLEINTENGRTVKKLIKN
jgi:hypothetical protein